MEEQHPLEAPADIMLRYHPSDPRSASEGYEGSLTSKEENALEELQSLVAAGLDLRVVRGDYGQAFDNGEHAVEPARLLLLRFLRGNAFSVSKALAQLRACVEHHAHQRTDELLAKSPRDALQCDVDTFNSFYPRWLMGFDRLGRPMLATQYGSLRLWEMTKLTTLERMTDLHVREQELLMRLLRRRTLDGANRSPGGGTGSGAEGRQPSGTQASHIVDTVVVIIDTAGLTLRHVTKDFVKLFKMRAHLDQLLFPETMGKCFIVNTPALFGYVWAMFSPFVDARTRAKSLLSRDTPHFRISLATDAKTRPQPVDVFAGMLPLVSTHLAKLVPTLRSRTSEYMRLTWAQAIEKDPHVMVCHLRHRRSHDAELLATSLANNISIIARPSDWQAALREVADMDQISPEYGGTGLAQKELPALADQLYTLGCRHRPVAEHGLQMSRRGASPLAGEPRSRRRQQQQQQEIDCGLGGVPQEKLPAKLEGAGARIRAGGEREQDVGEAEASSGRDSSKLSSSWLPTSVWGGGGWLWGGSGGGGGEDVELERLERLREDSGRSQDEEFFDAIAELNDLPPGVGTPSTTLAGDQRRGRAGNAVVLGSSSAHDAKNGDIEVGSVATPSRLVWRRSWRGSAVESPRPGAAAAPSDVRGRDSRAGVDAVVGESKTELAHPCTFRCAAAQWCCGPVLGRLQHKRVEELIRWLRLANAISVVLAVLLIIAGAFSLSTSWVGAVLGWQWGAITAVCLGSLLLLLALLGTVSARLQNRFSLLGFAVLEATVSCGMLLSGIWCLALAGGSASISDLTWEAMDEERSMPSTKETFLDGARNRLVILGSSSLALSLFSIAGPCILASVLYQKIRRLEHGGAKQEPERVFWQLRRSFHETNALCTAFACACTGYGGYALSFTISLGLAANVTSTYLLLAGGYLLLLTGAVGAWAAVASRPDAFRIHFGALVAAGMLYASLFVVQVVRARTSNERVKKAWPDLDADGEDMYHVQAKVRTMLIVGSVLSAAMAVLVIASAVASWAARRALVSSPGKAESKRVRLTHGEAMAGCWALALAATSTFFDGSFAVFSAWLARDREQAVWLVAFWRAMGHGDSRYVEGDTFVIASAVITAAVIGPGALLYAWSVYCRKGFRFSAGILVCAASIHTQVLRFVTQAGSEESDSETGGSKAVFIAASIILAMLQIGGAFVVLLYNVRRMTSRVHAAEVQYRALLQQHDGLVAEGARGR